MTYMLNYMKWSQKDASVTYKAYTSFVYVTPILGGYLADRYLGNKRAVIIGAVLMAVGHFLMAFEQYEIFMVVLVFLILGNGFFKPNMSTQVGRLYPAGDGRRDGAYTIFYMGINLGAFMSPLVCGWLQENTGWRLPLGLYDGRYRHGHRADDLSLRPTLDPRGCRQTTGRLVSRPGNGCRRSAVRRPSRTRANAARRA